MDHLVDVDLIFSQAAGRAHRQNLLDKGGYAVNSIQYDIAVLEQASVLGMRLGEKFRCAFDPGQRIFDLMCEACGRKPKVRRPLDGVFRTLLMG
jgi:hypothetical protein